MNLTPDAGKSPDSGGALSQLVDEDFSFLSKLLSQDQSSATSVPSPSSSSNNTASSDSSRSAKAHEELNGSQVAEKKRKLLLLSEVADGNGSTGDKEERRKLLSAKNARLYRSRKKVRHKTCSLLRMLILADTNYDTAERIDELEGASAAL
ncbi:unnamed protein product [Phytophthora lilii]|uniref:Unnamed protein product n=1 Tax=Phytophthora lilii TaxID=2077276 RepID=A0A9W6U4K4_9STRA|nr:unnamed protein product [Phytophthora lilii]